ncbi:hypothetical protein FE257_005151 [Aspergillus nanangensis]|uniref:Uncharacterized protein n=1 Tax=Aspergillus nanangensis TaxID=2582783 RepID=A0AAD4CBF2_ASPNN|nr:hypothetical protein FE257_005151 [Aspergillus nanangensis]
MSSRTPTPSECIVCDFCLAGAELVGPPIEGKEEKTFPTPQCCMYCKCAHVEKFFTVPPSEQNEVTRRCDHVGRLLFLRIRHSIEQYMETGRRDPWVRLWERSHGRLRPPPRTGLTSPDNSDVSDSDGSDD